MTVSEFAKNCFLPNVVAKRKPALRSSTRTSSKAGSRTHGGDTKTSESKNAVPAIEPHARSSTPIGGRLGTAIGFFAGEKMGRPLHLDNLSRRAIRPAVGDPGMAGIRFVADSRPFSSRWVPRAEIARTILRRADVSVTQEHYILLKSQREGRAAMKRLGRIVRQKFDNPARRKRSSRRKLRDGPT